MTVFTTKVPYTSTCTEAKCMPKRHQNEDMTLQFSLCTYVAQIFLSVVNYFYYQCKMPKFVSDVSAKGKGLVTHLGMVKVLKVVKLFFSNIQ